MVFFRNVDVLFKTSRSESNFTLHTCYRYSKYKKPGTADELVNASFKKPWKEHNYAQTNICCAMNKLTHWLLLEIFEKLFHNSM